VGIPPDSAARVADDSYQVEELEDDLLSDREGDGNQGLDSTDPADLPLDEYLKIMPVDREVVDITGETDLHTDLLNPNEIPPERKDLWLDENDQDPDCVIVEDPRAQAPPQTPPPEEPMSDEKQPGYWNMDKWLISPSQNRRQLYFLLTCPVC
jgi:hypothetical protein